MPIAHHHLFHSSWRRCWNSIGASGDGLVLMSQLLAAYGEPHRYYHTTQHLAECLTLFEQHIALAHHAAAVELAIWFHDAVYHVKANNNESLSATWAEQALHNAKVPIIHIDNIKALILATCHAAPAHEPDQQLLLDIDLAILGASRTRFEEYEQQIRQEYSWVPDFIFRPKRKTILMNFNSRHPLYNTTTFRDLFEKQARVNLAWALTRLYQ